MQRGQKRNGFKTLKSEKRQQRKNVGYAFAFSQSEKQQTKFFSVLHLQPRVSALCTTYILARRTFERERRERERGMGRETERKREREKERVGVRQRLKKRLRKL